MHENGNGIVRKIRSTKIYHDIKEFYCDTSKILIKNEEQNIIPLGNMIIGYEGKDKSVGVTLLNDL